MKRAILLVGVVALVGMSAGDGFDQFKVTISGIS